MIEDETCTFSELPYEVIVNCVFSFCEKKHNLFLWNNSDLELFGYFKDDPSRTVFFLFPSLTIGRSPKFVEHNRLHYVSLEPQDEKDLKDLIQNSSKLSNLYHLSINNVSFLNLSNLFGVSGGFPNLTRLSIQNYFQEKNANNWHQAKHVWSNLKRLRWEFGVGTNGDFPLFTKYPQYLENLEDFLLGNLKMNELTVLRLPNLKSLKIHDCENLVVDPGSRLKILQIGNICEDDRERNNLTDRIPEIIEKSQELKQLSLLGFDTVPIFELEKLGKKIEELALSEDLTVEYMLYSTEKTSLSFLTKLTISDCCNCDLKGAISLPFSSQIVSLSLLRIVSIHTDFFTKNKWSGLKFLKFEEIIHFPKPPLHCEIEGYHLPVNGPKSVPELLTICHFPNITEIHCIKSNLPYYFLASCTGIRLETLVIDTEFSGWRFGTGGTITNLTARNLSSEDTRQVLCPPNGSVHFRSLQQLKIISCDVLRTFRIETFCHHWENVRSLEIIDCANITDDFFNRNFEERWIDSLYGYSPEIKSLKIYELKKTSILYYLETLKLTNLPLVEGSEWSVFPRLRVLEVVNCPMFDDSLFQKHGLGQVSNLEEISIIGCAKVKGRGWGCLKKLKWLRLVGVSEDIDFSGSQRPSVVVSVIQL